MPPLLSQPSPSDETTRLMAPFRHAKSRTCRKALRWPTRPGLFELHSFSAFVRLQQPPRSLARATGPIDETRLTKTGGHVPSSGCHRALSCLLRMIGPLCHREEVRDGVRRDRHPQARLSGGGVRFVEWRG